MSSQRWFSFVPFLILLLAAVSSAQTTVNRDLLAVVQAQADAQRTFDQKALDRLLADDYVEVSPVGDVDSRAEVLGFYTAEARAKVPMLPSSVVLDEPKIRVDGDHAVVIVRETINMEVGGVARTVTMRVTAQLRKVAGAWKISSAQYTPIPPPRK